MTLTAAVCIGGMALWHDRAERAEQRQRGQTVEAQLLRKLHNMGGKLEFEVTDGGCQLTIKVLPGAWQLKGLGAERQGNAVVMLVSPRPVPDL